MVVYFITYSVTFRILTLVIMMMTAVVTRKIEYWHARHCSKHLLYSDWLSPTVKQFLRRVHFDRRVCCLCTFSMLRHLSQPLRSSLCSFHYSWHPHPAVENRRDHRTRRATLPMPHGPPAFLWTPSISVLAKLQVDLDTLTMWHLGFDLVCSMLPNTQSKEKKAEEPSSESVAQRSHAQLPMGELGR